MDHRMELCRSLGFGNILKAHEVIVAGARRDAHWMLRQRLNAKTLCDLGYTGESLERLGYAPQTLVQLGFKEAIAKEAPLARPAPSNTPMAPGEASETHIRALLEAGHKAGHLKQMSITVHHCKKAGLTATELFTAGFPVEDLVKVFAPLELRRFFSDHELRAAGYTADEMRAAGYSIADLLRMGYSENHVRSAGFSNAELMAAGLSRQVREQTK